MQKVIILHGWFGTPSDNWFPWLKDKLVGKEFEVIIPKLVDKDNPTLESWRKSVLDATNIDENTIIIGHSLGGVLALKLAEEFKFDTLITVAGWDYWDRTPEHKTFFENLPNSIKIIKNVKNRVVFHSDNDPYVTKFIAEEYSKRIKAKFHLLPGKGHFIKEDGVEEVQEIVEASIQ